MLTRPVEFDHADLYVSFVRERVRDLLAQGVPTIAVLAMTDLLCEVVNVAHAGPTTYSELDL
jgi:hypothetical protein